MYSYLLPVTALVKSESNYQFFTYRGKTPVTVTFRGKDIDIEQGTRFGVRPSSNGKFIRLIFPKDKTRVITIDLATAQKLAKGIGRD